jgi:hypothetical protein
MIDLTDIKMQSADGALPDFGALQIPVLGGPVSKVDRLGGGFLLKFATPPMRMEPDGRKFIARCQRAKRQGVIVEIPQPDLVIGAPGAGITIQGATSGGYSVAATGAAAGYVVREGQALNIAKNGHRYLYYAAADVALNGSGAGTIALTSPLRTHLVGGEAVNLAAPVMEGWMQGDNFGWAMQLTRTVSLEFEVLERA